jgi:glycosyltransferase involved in cell wall biosynthesis
MSPEGANIEPATCVGAALNGPRRANLHVYPSAFTHETRILKETKSIADRGLFAPIHIGGLWSEGLPERETLDRNRELRRVKVVSGRLPKNVLTKGIALLEWYIRIYVAYRKVDVDAVSCHSLTTLPLGIIFKVLRGTKVIYTTHELETETLVSPLQQRLGKIVERLLVRHADLVTVVSDSIADWYRREYGLVEVPVIRNVPYRAAMPMARSRVLRERLSLREQDLLFIYHGLLGPGRNVELLLEIFAGAKADRHIVFMGFGSLECTIQEYASKHANIHFHPAVPPEDVMTFCSSADVGVFLVGRPCLSYYYCLPNKLFEFLLSGIPCLVSDFPDMGKVVRESGAGWTSPVELAPALEFINNLTRTEVEDKRRAALTSRTRYGWEIEEDNIVAAYRLHLFAKPVRDRSTDESRGRAHGDHR